MYVVFIVSGSSFLLSAMQRRQISRLKQNMDNIVSELNNISILSESEKSFAIIYLKSSPNRAYSVTHVMKEI